MPTLQQQIESLASAFAREVLSALRSASLEEILGEQAGHRAAPRSPRSSGGRAPAPARVAAPRPAKPAAGKGGRLMRRSPEAITKEVDRIVAVLKKHKDGLRAEKIQAALGLRRKELPKPLAEGLAKKRLRKKGEKRATIYYAA